MAAADDRQEPAFDIHAADQQLTAMAQIPDELINELTVAAIAYVANAREQGAAPEVIAGSAHGLIAQVLAPVFAGADSPPMPESTTCKHLWGSGLGGDFTPGGVENHNGLLLQVCTGCGARRRL